MENNEKEIEEREIMTTEEDIDENNNEDRRFYVYEHIRKDNNTCFYVGKGTGDRAYNLDRGNFHNGVCKEYGCRVKIIKDGLTEKEAFALERERIEDYVITFGYGAPIDGYRDYSNNYLTNFTWGGEGTSGMNPWNKGKKGIQAGENNPFYGKHHTEEAKQKIGEKLKGKMVGEKNGMFGKNPWNKGKKGLFHHSEETKQRMSEKCKGKYAGERNPMFGKNAYANKTPEEMEEIAKKKSNSMKGKKLSEDAKQKISKKLSKKVICITTGVTFNNLKEASDHYNISKSGISLCCNEKYKYAGKLQDGTKLQWKYLEDDDNDDLKAV